MTVTLTPDTRLEELLATTGGCVAIELTCAPGQYTASRLASAVEDADAPLLGLWTRPADDGHTLVTLIVGASDSTAARRSLERYGYRVIAACDDDTAADTRIASERLGQLRVMLNV